MPGVCVVHLVWAPYGPAGLRRFLDALLAHDAGVPFELLLVLNGFGPGGLDDAFAAALDSVEYRVLPLPEPVQDLAAYRAALDVTGAEVVCCTNSHAEPLAAGWLARLVAALEQPGVGLAGATGSWESAFSDAPARLRLPRLRRFPRFPNPHLRTNAFVGRRELLLALDWSTEDSKLGALRLESGRRGLSAQVRGQGLKLAVVRRDGRVVRPDDWPESATYRSGAQEQLLVADNRTRQYADAAGEERRRLARMAWRRRASAG